MPAPPGTVKTLELPGHTVAGLAVTEEIVGTGNKVIVALPVLSPALAVQFASDKVTIVYVVVTAGFTTTFIVGAVPLNAVPSDKVPLIVPEPVTLRVRVSVLPVHIDAVPLITPVGVGLTVIFTEAEFTAAHTPLCTTALK